MSSQFYDLLVSAEFQSLLQSKKRFNLFKALGVQHKELVHSKLLAFFFNPKSAHGCGNAIVKAFLQDVIGLKQSGFTPSEFETIDFSEVIVRTEYYYIDLVLEFPLSTTVIAIENKIRADEGKGQIAGYQRKIAERYKHYATHKILFLTPKGFSSLTQDSESSVACVPVSYRCVLHALKNTKDLIAEDTADFFEQTILHIEDTILNEGKEQKLINEIWANTKYAETLKVLLKERPKLADIYEKYKNKVIKLCNDTWKLTPKFTVYPKQRGTLKEIKFQFQEWDDKGLPITFMFYQKDDNPAFRVLVYKKDYEKYKTKLNAFAENNKSEELPLDLNFSVITGWSAWHKIYVEEEDSESIYYDQIICDSKTLEWAVDQATEHVNKLKPLVENF